MQKLKIISPAFIIIAALLWSFDAILRRNLYTLSPAIIVFWEHVLGLAVITPFVIPRIQEIRQMNKKEWLAILMVSLFSGALGTIFYTAALGKVQYIQFSVVVLLQQLQPVWAILTAAILLKEKITRHYILWASLAIISSYLVTFRDLRVNVSLNNETFVAALLALSAGIVWAVSTSFSKIVLKKVPSLTATFLRFLLTPLFALILIFSFKQSPTLMHINHSQWIALLIITLSTGLVALLIYYYGLKKTPAKVSAICELVWPASAIFIDYFYFKNYFSITQIIGVIAVLFSIYKISAHKK